MTNLNAKLEGGGEGWEISLNYNWLLLGLDDAFLGILQLKVSPCSSRPTTAAKKNMQRSKTKTAKIIKLLSGMFNGFCVQRINIDDLNHLVFYNENQDRYNCNLRDILGCHSHSVPLVQPRLIHVGQHL